MTKASISELVATAKKVDVLHYEIQGWRDGTYFLQRPNGEGTEVPEEALAGMIESMIKKFF